MTILLQGAGLQATVTAPASPQFSSAEIGTVNASTVVVTFDQSVSADENDFASGVTIKVNGVAAAISGGIRQTNHAVIWYGIPVLWHGSGDVVTWEYSSGTGIIVSESDSMPLDNVSAQAVTNNCEYAALLDLQADTLVLNDGDPVSTWADQSGNGNDLAQTGDARPTKQTISLYPLVNFDGVNDWLQGGTGYGGGISQLTILCALHKVPGINIVAGRTNNNVFGGWYHGYEWFQDDDVDETHKLYIDFGTRATLLTDVVISINRRSNSVVDAYVNSVLDSSDGSNPPVTPDSTSIHFTLGKLEDAGFTSPSAIFAYLIFNGNPSATNRAALEARLAARYGIALS